MNADGSGETNLSTTRVQTACPTGRRTGRRSSFNPGGMATMRSM